MTKLAYRICGGTIPRHFQAAMSSNRITHLVSTFALFAFVGMPALASGADRTPQELQAAADAGDVEALFLLGKAYWNGKQVSKDQAKAVECFRRASEQDHVEAQASLGAAYALGQGVAKDLTLALDCFRKAAERGSALAQTNLGNTLIGGQGVEKDVGEGLEWLAKAGDQGFLKAQNRLAELYATGSAGVSIDYDKAIKWVRKAVDQDDPAAFNLYGVMLRDGLGTKSDRVSAVSYFRRAADKGILKAYLNLGNAYFFGQGVEVDRVQGMTWWYAGESLGEGTCGVVASQFTLGIDAEDIKKARKLAEEMARERRPALMMMNGRHG